MKCSGAKAATNSGSAADRHRSGSGSRYSISSRAAGRSPRESSGRLLPAGGCALVSAYIYSVLVAAGVELNQVGHIRFTELCQCTRLRHGECSNEIASIDLEIQTFALEVGNETCGSLDHSRLISHHHGGAGLDGGFARDNVTRNAGARVARSPARPCRSCRGACWRRQPAARL